MANLVSRASGNLTSTSTWKTVETGTRAIQNVFSGSTNTTTSDVYNGNTEDITIANLSVIEGILLYCNRVNTTGTVRVTLSADSGTTATKTVTVNASDLPASPSWVFFEFGTTLTGDGGTDYAIAIQGSSAGNATFYRNGTAANWTHFIVTNQNPASVAAGDVFYVVGELTGTGTGNDFTVTMDETATTDYGTGSDGTSVNGMEIGKRGILTYGTTAATNYYLKLSGSLNVRGDGTLNIGTTGTPIPRDSTAVLEFDPVADGGMGLYVRNGGTCNIQGLSRSSGKNIVACKLNTDEAVNSTSLGVDTDTGWLDNDDIVVASTTRTASQTEKGTLNGNAGASALTVDGFAGAGGGLANAHSGTSPTQAEVILLTRNVKVRSATSTLMTYCNFEGTSTVDIDWCEFRYLGENATDKKGIEIETTTGSFDMQYCSLYDTEDGGVDITSASGANTTISNNVFYNLNTVGASTAPGYGFRVFGGATATISNNIFMNINTSTSASFSGNNGIIIFGLGTVTFTGNTIVSSGNTNNAAVYIASGTAAIVTTSLWQNNIIHSSTAGGLRIDSFSTFNGHELGTTSIWRGSSSGIIFRDQTNFSVRLTLSNFTLFGNTTNSVDIGNSSSTTSTYADLVFNSLISGGDSSFATTNGINMTSSAGDYTRITLNGCDFSTVSGIMVAHTTDITGNNPLYQIFANYCKFGAATEFPAVSSNSFANTFIKSTNHDQTAGSHKAWFKYGTITTDTTAGMYRTASPSERLTPNNASNKLESGSKKVAVANGNSATISCYVRESVVGDGTDYNGNRPRLILKRNDAAGITSDTVIDTATASAEGAFEQLTGATATVTDDAVLEFVVDCDGTTGWVNVDDWSVS